VKTSRGSSMKRRSVSAFHNLLVQLTDMLGRLPLLAFSPMSGAKDANMPPIAAVARRRAKERALFVPITDMARLFHLMPINLKDGVCLGKCFMIHLHTTTSPFLSPAKREALAYILTNCRNSRQVCLSGFQTFPSLIDMAAILSSWPQSIFSAKLSSASVKKEGNWSIGISSSTA
jgi:hypothetical protein